MGGERSGGADAGRVVEGTDARLPLLISMAHALGPVDADPYHERARALVLLASFLAPAPVPGRYARFGLELHVVNSLRLGTSGDWWGPARRPHAAALLDAEVAEAIAQAEALMREAAAPTSPEAAERQGAALLAAAAALPTGDDWEAPTGEALVALERENLLRAFDGWQALLARSLGGPELTGRLGISRQRLNQLRREGRLLGVKVPIRREFSYPAWQFDEDGQPLAALPRLVAAAREAGLDVRELDALMVSPAAGGGTPLVNRLRAGQEDFVLGVIRAGGE